MIQRNQLRVLPPRLHQMHQPSQLFKTKQKVKVRIPMPPKMPKGRTDTPVCPSSGLRQIEAQTPACLSPCLLAKPMPASSASLHSAQNQNPPSHQRLQPDQPNRMRQILRK